MQNTTRASFVGYGAKIVGAARQAVHSDAEILVLIFAYCFAGQIYAYLLGNGGHFSVYLYQGNFLRVLLPFFIFFSFLVLTYRAVFVLRLRQPLSYISCEIRTNWLDPERLGRSLPVLITVPFFLSAFTSLKWMIPEVAPFAWDEAFRTWDGWMHGGQQPWRLLHFFLGAPLPTFVLNLFYNLWIVIMPLVLLWQILDIRYPVLRRRFLVTYLLCWILLGTVAATLLASAGPAYFGRVTGLPDPFVPLVNSLEMSNRIYPIWAIEVQEMLWRGYTNRELHLGAGISAMPSMHVSMAVLFALAAWQVNRSFGALMTAYAIIIALGSVHLAWHYAVDGYFAAIATLFVWYGAGRFCYRPTA